ncbi:MAG: hypothetical protein O3A20_08760 [Planctomycetota bacterium]|nr:hypothetical protein [Planctomycetota bacterium]
MSRLDEEQHQGEPFRAAEARLQTIGQHLRALGCDQGLEKHP